MHATVPDPALVLKAQSLKTNPVLQVAVPVLGPVAVPVLVAHLLDQGVVLIRLPAQVLEAKVRLRQLVTEEGEDDHTTTYVGVIIINWFRH